MSSVSVPIVGLTSMNQTIVDGTDVREAWLGDENGLLGVQSSDRIRVDAAFFVAADDDPGSRSGMIPR